MGTLSAGLIAGNYYPVYEAYYQQVDPNNKGSVGALDAARFLKTSGLSDTVLSKIWDLADSNAKGFLTKSGFFIALKLIALVQAGKEPTTVNLSLDIPPPRLGDGIPPVNRPVTDEVAFAPAQQSESDWVMKPAEKLKYDQLFNSLNPCNGYIGGNKVKGLLMDSKLPVDTLGKIWDLADMDKDGALDRHEFAVAMHLVYKALEKYAIPSCLPPELLPPSKRKDSVPMPGAIPVLPIIPNGVRSETPVAKLGSPPLVQPVAKPLVQSPLTSIPPMSPVQSSFVQPAPIAPLIPSVTSPPLISSSTIPSLIPSAQTPPLIPPVNSSHVPPVTSALPPPLIPPNSQLPRKSIDAVEFLADKLLTPPEEMWVISKEEKVKYDALFEQADLDKDGFVSGHEIKDTFLKSGVAQQVLAHIWALCDIAEQGKLNKDQFALALWLISRKLKGIDPPAQLTQEMIPPSCRKSSSEVSSNEPFIFSSPQVDKLTNDIDDLVKEKLLLETNITQIEADIKIKSSEIKSLQGELDTLVATLKQLENQKGEAMKRINDLKVQKDEVESSSKELSISLESAEAEVGKLRTQAEEQDKQLKSQEAELNRKKQELENLKTEEATLKKEREKMKKEIESTTTRTTEATEIINEVKAKMIELDDFQKQLTEAISHLNTVLESNSVTSLSEIYMNIEPNYGNQFLDVLSDQIFKVMNPTPEADRFLEEQGQSNIANKTDTFNNDPFASKDPFGSEAAKINNTGFAVDPFASFNAENTQKADPFGNSTGSSTTTSQKAEDPFGCDPFAILHAPTKPGSNLPSPSVPRSESPSPALPPKKGKQPPPRPAPPRPAPPSLPSGFDADFADFSAFNNKISSQGNGFGTSKSDNSGASSRSINNSKKDPFRDYRYDDPFEMADEIDFARASSVPVSTNAKNSTFDPFAKSDAFSTMKSVNGVSKSATSNFLPPEEQQLAWATTESMKSEKERRKRLEQQEKADYKLAMKLSKAESKGKGDGKKKSSRPKILR